METILFLLFLLFVVPAVIKALTAAAKNREMAKLKETNPEAYLQLKQMEHEQQMMAHQKRLMSHNRMKTGMSVGAFLLRLLMKK